MGFSAARPAPAQPLLFARCLAEGNFNLCIAAGSGRIDRRNHSINVSVNGWPLRVPEYHDGKPPNYEVLLVLNVGR
jgi:hypothetical protein